jgi:hypothetical protein
MDQSDRAEQTARRGHDNQGQCGPVNEELRSPRLNDKTTNSERADHRGPYFINSNSTFVIPTVSNVQVVYVSMVDSTRGAPLKKDKQVVALHALCLRHVDRTEINVTVKE